MPQKIQILENEVGLRLDRWLKKRFPFLTYSFMQKLFRTGQIRVNGRRVKGTHMLEVGEEIRLPPLQISETPQKPSSSFVRPKDLQLLKDSILFENEELIALNKPAGWAVQGGTNTLIHLDEMWKAVIAQQELNLKEVPRIVHRLDKDTTGALLFAKTLESARYLTHAFKEGVIRKTYWAITVGVPDPLQGSISFSLKKGDGKGREKMILDPEEGKDALTLYKTLKHTLRISRCEQEDEARGAECIRTYMSTEESQRLTNPRVERQGEYHKKDFAWLELKPQTGRTHQLRIHCAEIGASILGDGKYGGRAAHPLERRTSLMLHARSIEFFDALGKLIRIEAPMPDAMKKIIERLF